MAKISIKVKGAVDKIKENVKATANNILKIEILNS
jgi:hypothetical protein